MGAAVGEKGLAATDKEMGATEKGEVAGDKEKGPAAEKGGAAVDEDEEEDTVAMAKDKGPSALPLATGEVKNRAKAEEKEAMLTRFSGIALSEKKGTAAAAGEKRELRRMKRGRGQQPEQEEAMAETAEEVAGEKEPFFFKAKEETVTLTSWDGMPFKVSEEAARVSVVLADTIDQGCAGSNIHLPEIDARTLATVIAYCNKHAASHGADEGGGCEASVQALEEWDRRLIYGLIPDAVYDLIPAANFLHIKGLVDAACQKVSDMVKGKTREQMREIEKEAVFEWFPKFGFSGKGARRAPRRFRRTTGQQPEKKGEAAEEVAGEAETFVFRARSRGKFITLKTSDGKLFNVSEEAAQLSVLLADMIDEGCAGSIIPLANVDARSLATVIEYCNKHAAAATKPSHSVNEASSSNSEASGEALKDWDRKLIDGLSLDALYDLIQAANFLHVKKLLEAACQKVADMIKGKTPEQVRTIFGIANDFTKEEEEEMRNENPWAFED